MNMSENNPYPVDLEGGKQYFWCRCGKSANQPFCDGSHQGSELQPVAFTPVENKTVYLCGCKQTGDQPFCDGSHQSL